jgi:hypothetical protein
MIRDCLIPAIKDAFPDKRFAFSEPPDPIIQLPSGITDIGDLTVYDDCDEATVCITEITHLHVNPYDPSLTQDEIDQRVTDEVLAFLRSLFSDHVLLYRHPSRRSGCCSLFEEQPDSTDINDEYEYFLWSGPFSK